MRGHGFLCLIHVEMRTSSLISILVKPLGNHYKEEQKEAFSHIYREREERGKEKKRQEVIIIGGGRRRWESGRKRFRYSSFC